MFNIAGYFRGKPGCTHDLEWLPVAEAELLRRKLIRFMLDVFQLIGGARDSAGYHLYGGNADLGQDSDDELEVFRNMGAAASPRGDEDGMVPHTHLALKGCTHMKSGPRWQVTELEAGRNGLVNQRADRGPRRGVKWPLRTYRQGIKWAAEQLYAQSARKHAPVRYYVTGGKLAGRSYPGVGPVLVRRPKGFRISAVATYTAPDGSKHVRTKYGTWYALAYLAAVKPTKKKPPVVKKPTVVTHTARPALGRKVADVMTWNLGLLNLIGKARWTKNRAAIAKIIRANKLDVLFLQETHAAAARWLEDTLDMQRIGGQARPILLDRKVTVLGWEIWTPAARLRKGKAKPVTFATVILNGTKTLLVNCHPQHGATRGPLRGVWAHQVLEEAERRSERQGGIPIICAGDLQGGEFAKAAKNRKRELRRAITTAHATVNAHLKSFNKWSATPADGYQMDDIISDLVAAEQRLIWNEIADHNRVRASLHLPA